MKIWCVDYGRCVMHDSKQCDPIQRQDYERLKVGHPSICNSYHFLCLLQLELAPDHGFLN